MWYAHFRSSTLISDRAAEQEVDPILERRTELIFLATLLLAFLVHVFYLQYSVDDAFISFRYAKNLVDGHGLVFNQGERVEGYTNFLWTLLMAAGIRAGFEPVVFSRVAGTLAGLVLLTSVFRFARSHLPDGSIAFLVLVPLAANGALAVWSVAGLETVLFTLFLFVGAAVAVGREGRVPFLLASALFALATLTRPEGALFYVVLLADRLLQRRISLKGALPGLLLFTFVLIPFEMWRFVYYGDWLPNTFYAKAGGGVHAAARGLGYLGEFFGRFGGWSLAAPLPLLLIGNRRSWERTFIVLLAAYLLYVVVVGGDSLPFFRFLVPAIPFFAILAIAGLDRLFSFRQGNVGGIRVIAFAVLLALPLYGSFRGEAIEFLNDDRLRVELHWKVIGAWLAEHADPDATIAVTTAGAIPYYSGLRTIDMLGITDREIAHRKMPHMGEGLAGHEKHDMAYVLSRKPTYILPSAILFKELAYTTGPSPKLIVNPGQFKTKWNRGLEELPTSETFLGEYRVKTAQIGNMHLVYFERRKGI